MIPEQKLIIGSYPYRGNVHVCRLLCEYLQIPYENIFFNPLTWKNYREKQAVSWLFEELPFLKDGDLVVTQPMPMCNYIIKKSGRQDLFGKTLDDMLVVDKFFWGKDMIQNFLSLIVENKNDPSKLVEQLRVNWVDMKKKLLEFQEEACPGQFYLGYLSLIDFMIHELYQYFRDIFKKEGFVCPKLAFIREKIASIPVIREFQASNRSVRDKCPLDFYRKWKHQTMKACPTMK